jgi:DNA polymerase-3 subunit epsilon
VLKTLPRRRASRSSTADVGFAVVDLETTGLFARAHDRVVEIAVVHCDRDGTPGAVWSTLVNPGRDLGPTDIHGIRGRDVVDAPTFAEVIGDVSTRLCDRVLVAHNARFDRDFLQSEFEHAGATLPRAPWVCTMDLASRAVGARRLSACCEALAVNATPSHSAQDDAWAATLVLAACLARHAASHVVAQALADARIPSHSQWPSTPPSGRLTARSNGRPPRRETYVGLLLDRLPSTSRSLDGAEAAYLELLIRVLEDRVLTPGETDGLGELAESWRIGRDKCVALHHRFLESIVAEARRDGVVTDAERADLDDVAAVLAIEPATLTAMLAAPFVDGPSPPRDQWSFAGKSVCFTGQATCTIAGRPITREHAAQLAAERGLDIRESVTKKLDLLVVADPDSLSGKARKARDYGTRIMVERAFWQALRVPVD